jgi:anti-sigma regulatory factor (Ser/Thr protein kinase)
MSFTDLKREQIKKYLLRKISVDDPDLIAKTMDAFGISVTTVKRYLREGLELGIIEISDEKACKYRLKAEEFSISLPIDNDIMSEDIIFSEHIAPMLYRCNDKAKRIWQYACPEIINNALEHSGGSKLYIHVVSDTLNTSVIISDNGLGTFTTILEYMRGHGWKNPRIEEALVELYKGKLTRDREHHSGEGIFFSSKMLDRFILWSDSLIYQSGCLAEQSVIQSHLAAYASRISEQSTTVIMQLENETDRDNTEIFSKYSDIDEGFIRTIIPVREACITSDPVARSQARRICSRLDEFKEVILDFINVDFMGQGFADELFRVYALAHPEVTLSPINMLPGVGRMIKHISRGEIAPNIRLQIQ